MAIDAYLQIDGIKGESQDSAHQGWIELVSAHWGVLQPGSVKWTHQSRQSAGEFKLYPLPPQQLLGAAP